MPAVVFYDFKKNILTANIQFSFKYGGGVIANDININRYPAEILEPEDKAGPPLEDKIQSCLRQASQQLKCIEAFLQDDIAEMIQPALFLDPIPFKTLPGQGPHYLAEFE